MKQTKETKNKPCGSKEKITKKNRRRQKIKIQNNIEILLAVNQNQIAQILLNWLKEGL